MSHKGNGKSNNVAMKRAIYKSTDKRKTNKIRKLIRHLKKFPKELQAKKCLSLMQ